MSLLDNQTYKKNLSFVRIDDDDKTVSFTICVCCNHDINKSVLADIELVINDLFLQDYQSQEELDQIKKEEKKMKQLQKEEEKMKREQEKKLKKAEETNTKLVEEYHKRVKKAITKKK
ncbi:hypothetical protein EON65_55550 [archaeon]|nr:MAG: hypothetical protein EON65_55550 [archaeon]